MNKIIFLFLISVCILSCNQQNKFSISGNISDVPAKTYLYLEHLEQTKTQILDSVLIGKDGNFKFKASCPAYPDLYRLRLGNRKFIFPIDSCEQIIIRTSADNLSFPTTIENSYKAEEITKLRHSVVNIQNTYNAFQKKEIDQESMLAQVMAHKEMVQKLILENPLSITAYFALFQKINDFFIFSPYDKSDRAYYSAVATSFHNFMPEYNRSKSIYNLVLTAINEERKAKNNIYLQELIKNADTGIIDIELPNQFGNIRSLSQLKGKVVLLDFSACEAKERIEYVFTLRELYDKYTNRDFEIFQVSVDSNKLLWKQATEFLPWICVRDEKGPYAQCLITYNISKIPTTFLIDKNGDIVGRDISFEKLPAEIEKCLKKKS